MFESNFFKMKNFKYKYPNIFNALLKRMCKKLILNIKIKNNVKCINTLKTFVKINNNKINLKHVYYKHFL